MWEHLHRRRRQAKLKAKAIAEAALGTPDIEPPTPAAPRLRLLTVEPPVPPELEGRTLASVKFRSNAVELEFMGASLEITGNASIAVAGERYRYPESGSRDALCSLLGERVDGVRVTVPDRIEIHFESGGEIAVARSGIAVA